MELLSQTFFNEMNTENLASAIRCLLIILNDFSWLNKATWFAVQKRQIFHVLSDDSVARILMCKMTNSAQFSPNKHDRLFMIKWGYLPARRSSLWFSSVYARIMYVRVCMNEPLIPSSARQNIIDRSHEMACERLKMRSTFVPPFAQSHEHAYNSTFI